MEVLRKSRKVASIAILACAILIILFGALYSVGSVSAYADNADDIGKDTATILFADVTVRENGLSYSSSANGVTVQVKFPSGAYEISVAYEVEFSESVYPIGGAPQSKDEEASYTLITEDYTAPEEAPTDGVAVPGWVKLNIGWARLASGWTKPATLVSGYTATNVTVNMNGIMYVKCAFNARDGEGNVVKQYIYGKQEINIIDVLAPERSSVTQSRIPDGATYRNEIKATFADVAQTGSIPSARSGLLAIAVYYSPVALTELEEEDVKELSIIKEWHTELTSAVIQSQTIGFTVYEDGRSDGYYYALLTDRVGNVGIYDFFGGKYTAKDDSRYVVYSTSGGVKTPINVLSNLNACALKLEEYKTKVTESVYNSTYYAYSELVWAFNDGEYEDEEEHITAVSKRYWAFFQETYPKFLNAAEGAKYDFEVKNSDLLFGKLRITNFEGSVSNALGGQTVLAEVNVARYDFHEVASEITELAGMGKKGKVFKLNYKLTVDGSSAYVASEPLIFELGGDVATFIDTSKFALVAYTTAAGYTLKEYDYGSNWIRFSTVYNQIDIYIVVPEESLPANYDVGGDELSPGAIAGIVIGSVAGACLIGVGVYFILRKKGIVGKKGKVANDTQNALDNAQSADNSQKPTKPSKNKSKKRKKHEK